MRLITLLFLFVYINCSSQKIVKEDHKLHKFLDVKTLKYGLKDSLDNIIVPAKYDYLRLLSSYRPYCRVKLNGKSGMINTKGEVTIPIIYKYFRGGSIWNRNVAKDMDNRYGIISNDGEIIVPFDYDKLTFNFDSTYIFQKGSKMKGVIDDDNKVIIDNVYENLKLKSNSFAYLKDGKWGLISKEEDLILENEYESINTISSSYLSLEKDSLVGLYSLSDQTLILPFEYSSFSIINESFLKIRKGRKSGLYNFVDGKIELPIVYDYIKEISPTLYFLKKEDREGLYSTISKTDVVPLIYDKLKKNNDGNFLVEHNDQYGIIDTSNNMIIDFQDLKIMDHYNGTAIVTKFLRQDNKSKTRYNLLENNGLLFSSYVDYPDLLDSEKWLKNKKGHTDDEYSYDKSFDGVSFYHYGKRIATIGDVNGYSYRSIHGVKTLLLKVNEKWGAFKINSEQMLTPKYDEIKSCKYYNRESKDLPRTLLVKISDKYGVISEKEEVIIPIKYDKIYFVEYGWIIKDESGYGFILADNTEMSIPPMYESMSEKYNRLICKKDGKFGVVDYFNEVKIAFEYDSIDKLGLGFNDIFLAKKDGLIEVYDKRWRKMSDHKYLDVQKVDHETLFLKSEDSSEEVLWEDFFQMQFEK